MKGDRAGEARLRKRPRRLLAGQGEPVFAELPERVLANLQHPGSENALLWNLIYPLAQPSVSLRALLAIKPLWGTWRLEGEDEALTPYYWGYSLQGVRMPGLDSALEQLDGVGSRTEVDLFLVGQRSIILAEAKHLSGLGRCGRYQSGRCPEVHAGDPEQAACRYWIEPGARFTEQLEFGDRPTFAGPEPPCNRHYQLGRTLLLGSLLASELSRTVHLWLLVPRTRWESVRTDWIDFTQRVRQAELWRRLRVLAWEDLRSLTGS